ncbi:glycoside hydrolase superfamily [Leptodontidium sp. MPI-SDFR-AT-0119]|nr:glycoside hydrolase superfamily [Leptodontidium sp. MPI-SDFR-AT-0119]
MACGEYGRAYRGPGRASGRGLRLVARSCLDRAIYDRKFNPQDLLVDNLTHILYAFANIKPDTGEYLSDAWANTDIPFPEDSLSEAGTNIYGCLKQLYLIKKKNRYLKVLLSISSSSYLANFAAPVSTVLGRTAFALTAVTLEFPADHTKAGNIVLLLQNIREALDAYRHSLSPLYHFQLIVTCLARPTNYQIIYIADMDKFTAIKYYLSQNVSSNKLVLSVPIYSRSFGVTNSLGKPFNGVSKGTWEAGIYDYKDLLLRGAVKNYDNASGASYSYDTTTRELISYDTIMAGNNIM